ncbi:MAG: SDR family oxidoreductase [Bacteroidota bacterium]
MSAEGRQKRSDWALILGASSGFGGAVAVELAKLGLNIFGVHLDRQATMRNVERVIRDIRQTGSKAVFYNINAADTIKREETIDDMVERLNESGSGSIRVFLHSLAFGSLKPFIAKKAEDAVNQAQLEMTLDVMANSLVYWTQGLVNHKLIKRGGRIFAMTSSGGHTVMPYYGAISAAKAALESHIRQLAMELGPMGITANAILAGVTITPALRKIPGSDRMIEYARMKNPGMRLTVPEDVAKAIALLYQEGAGWISGNVIHVDGGEDVVGFLNMKQ